MPRYLVEMQGQRWYEFAEEYDAHDADEAEAMARADFWEVATPFDHMNEVIDVNRIEDRV